MYRIAICDTEEKVVEELTEKLNRIAPKFNAEIQIYKYTEGKEMIISHIRYNLIFLDIKGIEEIKTARKIRRLDSQVQIVYMTDKLRYLKEAYKIHAFDYIQKPCKEADIRRVLEDYLKFTNFIKKDVIKLRQTNGRDILVSADSIIYISCGTKKREVIVITKNNDYICKGIINEIYSELSNFDFFMPHRSHIVNLSEVKTYIKNEKIYMNNDDEIPLSKGRSKEFEEKYKKKLEVLL